MVDPVIWGDPFLDALEPAIERHRAERRRQSSLSYRQSLELMRAIRCAPTIGIAEAMLRRERVPVSQLDPNGAKAYGLVP